MCFYFGTEGVFVSELYLLSERRVQVQYSRLHRGDWVSRCGPGPSLLLRTASCVTDCWCAVDMHALSCLSFHLALQYKPVFRSGLSARFGHCRYSARVGAL
jgi:hypothetical protein